jgi:hypothetical protein
MTRYAAGALRAGMAFLLASAAIAAGVLPAAAATGTTTCPRGRAAVIDVEYVIFHSDGTSEDVSTLHRHVRLGDTVNALFNVPVLPAGCPQVELSLASYSSRGHPSRQRLFSSATGEFLPGGRYELSATVAPRPSAEGPHVYFTLVFATGPVLARPRYRDNLIQAARNFSPK